MSIHQGLLSSNDLKSLPTLTVETPFRCSFVNRKLMMNITKQAEATQTIAQNQPSVDI